MRLIITGKNILFLQILDKMTTELINVLLLILEKLHFYSFYQAYCDPITTCGPSQWTQRSSENNG